MASIRKRNGLWQAQVRSRKIGSTSKSFHKKSDALAWAKIQEAMMQTGEWKPKDKRHSTLGDLIQTYLIKTTPNKKGAEPETRRLNRLLNETDLMQIKLDDARPHHFATFRDKRLKDGNRACQYDLVLLRAAWNTARIEWGWDLIDNPLTLIRFPKSNPPRERRLKRGEYERLMAACAETKVWYLWPMIEIAITTCMRRGEILSLEWKNIDFERTKALLPNTKNGRSRWVPLPSKVIRLLERLPKEDERVFPITDTAVRQSWDRLHRRAGIVDLTFHDLRHEAISRQFESGLSIPHVMAISGHQTASQLFRYVQISENTS
ncbi:MAG: site-specific integrase [Burkholderiales bacterium]|nr:site-specific integrase [Burkholderiales bacterium]